MTPRRFLPAALPVVLLAGALGCRLTMPHRQPEAAIHSPEDLTVSQNQLRLRMRGLVDPLCGVIEAAADQIAAAHPDGDLPRAALEWKMEAIPALRESLFQPNPFTATLDTWVLCFQMADYFESGPGRVSLGEASSLALAACRRLEETLQEAAIDATHSGDVSDARDFARRWARDHPIRHSIAGRDSTLSRALEEGDDSSFSTGEVVVGVATTLDDLNRRLELLSDQLPRQARWEVERFAAKVTKDLEVDRALPLAEQAVDAATQAGTDLHQLTPRLERALAAVEEAPGTVTAEREAAIRALREEVSRAIQFLHEERTAVLAHLTQERIAALGALQTNLFAEHQALVADLDRVSRNTVDHALGRLMGWSAAVLVTAFLGLALLLFLARTLFLPRASHPSKGQPHPTGLA